MKKSVLTTALLLGSAGTTPTRNITADAPSSYKVVVAPSPVSAPQAVNVATIPQAVYAAPAPAPAPIYRARPYV